MFEDMPVSAEYCLMTPNPRYSPGARTPLRYVDKVVDIPIHKQVHVPMVQTAPGRQGQGQSSQCDLPILLAHEPPINLPNLRPSGMLAMTSRYFNRADEQRATNLVYLGMEQITVLVTNGLDSGDVRYEIGAGMSTFG